MALVVLASLLILSALILIASIHPFWAIIECAVSTKLEGTRKALWILAILLTWTLASFLYGLFATYSPSLRRVTQGCSLLILILLLVFGYLFMTNPEVRDAVLNQAEIARLQSNPTEGNDSRALPDVQN